MNKFLVCFLLVAYVANNVASMNVINEAQKAIIQAKFLQGGVGCLKKHHLSFSDIRTLRSKMMPDSDNAKCFTECLFKKIGIMDDMGKLSAAGAKENAMQIFKDSEDHLKKVDQFIEVCSSVNDHDLSEEGKKGCDRAKLAFACLVENAPKFGFDVEF